MGGRLAPRQGGQAGGAAAAVGLLAFACGALFARTAIDSYDAGIMFQVARSMAAGTGFGVPPVEDKFGLNTPYASYGIGMSLLMLPALWLGPLIRRPPELLVMLIAPALFALTTVALWGWARTAGASPRLAAVVAFVTVLATPLLAYTSTAFSEVGVALGIALGLWGGELAAERRLAGGLLAGAGASVALLMRPDSAVLVLPWLGLACLQGGTRAALGYAAGVVPALTITAAYNAVRFGSPLVPQYAGVALGRWFNHPFLVGLYGLTVSPGRGILIYAPVVALAAAALPWAWRRSRTMAALCVVLLLVRIAFYAPLTLWAGGTVWGPRFLVPAMPVLAPLVYELARRWSRLPMALRGASALVVLLSVGLQVLGAAVRYESDTVYTVIGHRTGELMTRYSNWGDILTAPEVTAATDRVLLDWRFWPVPEHARRLLAGQEIASPLVVRLLPRGGPR